MTVTYFAVVIYVYHSCDQQHVSDFEKNDALN